MTRFNIFPILLFYSIVQTIHSDVIPTNRNEGPIIQTNVGSIRGLRDEDGNFNMFLGIPYATVNESNVFGNSIPHPAFEGVFEAYDDSSICPQIEEFNFTSVGSLDCLNLNIYVPDSATPENPLPVMVYIYGGGFSIGFAGGFLYGPRYLVRHDVILVTLNYRLGPYGFMCLDTPEIAGNQGLKDQVTALRWVRNNIGAFGGDTNQVTVFGNSAGGMSIGLHLISETERLFTRAIMQSGAVFSTGLVSEGNLNAPLILAESLGFITNNVNEALAFLSSADVQSVIEAVSGSENFGVCLEKSFPGEERFLSQNALNSNFSKAANLDIMLGYNSHELISIEPSEQVFFTQLSNNFNMDETNLTELATYVRRFYIGDADINENVRPQINVFLSDLAIVYSTIRSIAPYLNAGANKVYQYMFSYYGGRNFIQVKNNISLAGAIHADEIGYLFEMRFIPDEPTPEDQLTIDRMTAMWTNFAKYSDPTPETNTLLPVKWEPITQGSQYHYLVIDSTLRAGRRYEHKRMSFWDLFYNGYGEFEVGYEDSNQDDQEEDGDENEVDPIAPVEPSSASSISFNVACILFMIMLR